MQTALVNEAYLPLAGQMGKDWKNRLHFFAVAAQLMRRILVDYARTQKTRNAVGDGNAWICLKLPSSRQIAWKRSSLSMKLSIGLRNGMPGNAKWSNSVFSPGFSETEVAEVLKVVPRTVKR